MPSGKNWLNFLYVNLVFIIYIAGTMYLSQMKQIKDNWQTYRCNPLYMPLADDVGSNFNYCMQNSMSGFMGVMMEPITYLSSSMSNTFADYTNQINGIRGMFDKVRKMISSITETIYSVFLNLILEFQKIIIGIRDLMGKTIGIMVTLIYIMQGSIKTMESAWKGPTGQLVNALGKCFHPDTKLKLANGAIVSMKDIVLGDILENGSVVNATMKIDNTRNPEVLYCIRNKGVHNEDIYVTGSHYILDKESNTYITVSEYKYAEKTDKIIDWFCCFITSNHRITIGDEMFWDWEDHVLRLRT
jgi:hypothetical protein